MAYAQPPLMKRSTARTQRRPRLLPRVSCVFTRGRAPRELALAMPACAFCRDPFTGGSIAWISREGHLKVGPKSDDAIGAPVDGEQPEGGQIVGIERDGDVRLAAFDEAEVG
jgi:hypothetical protein